MTSNNNSTDDGSLSFLNNPAGRSEQTFQLPGNHPAETNQFAVLVN